MNNTSFSISDSPLQSPKATEHETTLQSSSKVRNESDDDEHHQEAQKAKFVELPDHLKNDSFSSSSSDEKEESKLESQQQQQHIDPSSATLDNNSIASNSNNHDAKAGHHKNNNHHQHPLSEEEYAAAKALKEKLDRERLISQQQSQNMFLEDDDDDEDMEEFVRKQQERKKKLQEEAKLKSSSSAAASHRHGSGSIMTNDTDSNNGTTSVFSSGDNDENNNNSDNNGSSSFSAFLSTIDYSSHPRYGFSCRLEPPIAVREEARCRLILQQHIATADTAWKQGLKGATLLYQADNATCEQLKKYTRKYGCPPSLRAIVWLTMTKVACKVEEHQPQGYGAMLEKAMPADKVIPELTRQSIEQDLDRTFPEHPYFRKNAEGHRKLRWVLHNLFRRSPINGYCQSYNFIAATFLLVLGGDVEATLWLILLTFETLVPNDYYNSQLDGVKIDQRVLEDLIHLHIPKISQHFKRIGFESGMLIPVWVMSGFTNCLPMETAIAVWDWVFAGDTKEQTPGLLIIAISLLKNYSEEILMTDDPNDTAMLLSQLSDITFDWPKLLKTANEMSLLISSEAVQHLRRKHRALCQQEEMKREAKRLESEAAKKRLENLKIYGTTSSPTSPNPVVGNASPFVRSPQSGVGMDLEEQHQNESMFILSTPKTAISTSNSASLNNTAKSGKVDPTVVSRAAQANTTFGETMSPKVTHETIEMRPKKK